MWMLLCASLMSSDAHAYEPIGLGASLGADWVVSDPFVRRRGLHFGLEYAPRPFFSAGFLVAGYPNFGQADWKPLTTQLVEENRVSPDLSRITARADLVARFTPLWREGEHISTNAGLHVGFGAVRTVDDLEAMQAEDDPVAQSTQIELHPTLLYGLSAEMRTDYVVGFRVRAEHVVYVETVNGTTLERKNNRFFGVELTAWI
jgi:hypothetical protein